MTWYLDARWGGSGSWTVIYKTDSLDKAQKAEIFLKLGKPPLTELRIRQED